MLIEVIREQFTSNLFWSVYNTMIGNLNYKKELLFAYNKVSDLLNVNKLTLNAKKSNYVIFRFGAKRWNAIPNEFRQLSKRAFEKNFHDFLLSIMEAEDDYVEAPILLQKMAMRR